ncbi:hypothetical protein COO60DRAFT_1627822 [Scenedesmus sp. NREL 46B-D3]|nr:hypothetical protein COO60DRAFT_1627822 [Scenedesmus sp. NREL 46B-D3]
MAMPQPTHPLYLLIQQLPQLFPDREAAWWERTASVLESSRPRRLLPSSTTPTTLSVPSLKHSWRLHKRQQQQQMSCCIDEWWYLLLVTRPAPGLSEGRVLELVSHEVQRVSQELQQSLAQELQESLAQSMERVSQELQQSLAQSMEEMQAGLLSVISSRAPQRTARGCLATISERGESLGDAVGLAGTKYIKA